MKRGVQIFEEDSKILETIAKQYGTDSKEYAALTHATMALLYVLTEQRAHLSSLGIDPDSEIS